MKCSYRVLKTFLIIYAKLDNQNSLCINFYNLSDSDDYLSTSTRNIKKINKRISSFYNLFRTMRSFDVENVTGTLNLSMFCEIFNFCLIQRSTDISKNNLEKTILWGPSCDSTDRVMQNLDVMLPRCTPLDWLVFTTQGAYTYGFSSHFSCLEKPLTRSVISKELW